MHEVNFDEIGSRIKLRLSEEFQKFRNTGLHIQVLPLKFYFPAGRDALYLHF